MPGRSGCGDQVTEDVVVPVGAVKLAGGRTQSSCAPRPAGSCQPRANAVIATANGTCSVRELFKDACEVSSPSGRDGADRPAPGGAQTEVDPARIVGVNRALHQAAGYQSVDHSHRREGATSSAAASELRLVGNARRDGADYIQTYQHRLHSGIGLPHPTEVAATWRPNLKTQTQLATQTDNDHGVHVSDQHRPSLLST